jgi:hypothetical protein
MSVQKRTFFDAVPFTEWIAGRARLAFCENCVLHCKLDDFPCHAGKSRGNDGLVIHSTPDRPSVIRLKDTR